MIDCFRGVVHPWLCDSMGHLTTRHYAAMFDDAAYHLFAALGFTPQHMQAGIGFADVKADFSYRRELNQGALTRVSGKVIALGNSSFTAYYEMHELGTDHLAATMESVTVQFDLKRRKSVPLLPEIRSGALRFMQCS